MLAKLSGADKRVTDATTCRQTAVEYGISVDIRSDSAALGLKAAQAKAMTPIP